MDSFYDFLSGPGGAALIGVAGFVLVFLRVRLDSRSEERHRKYLKAAAALRTAGFEHIPVLLEDLALQDISGALKKVVEIAEIFNDPVRRAAELQKVCRLVLTDLMRDPEKRPMVLKWFDDIKAANLPDATSVLNQAIGDVVGQQTALTKLADARGLIGDLLGKVLPGAKPAIAAVEALKPEAAHQ